VTHRTEHQRRHVLTCVVAVIGSDGSGKSTLTNDLINRLQDSRGMALVYLGQSSGNIADALQQLPLIGEPLVRYLKRRAEKTHHPSAPSHDASGKPTPVQERSAKDTPAALAIFLLSLWRAWKFRRVLALNRRHILVITDRYPQAEQAGFYFDGPGLQACDASNWFTKRLWLWEQGLYQWMANHVPVLVIRLNIDAATAHHRKPDHKLAMLEQKTNIIPTLHFAGANILELDSTSPYSEVLNIALDNIRAIRDDTNSIE